MQEGLIYVGIGVGVVIVVMTALNFLWDRKYRPGRMKKGIPTATFSNIIKRASRILFKHDTARKIVAPRDYYIASLVGTVLFLFLGKFLVAVSIFGLFVMVAFGRSRQIMTTRHKILMRMFEVANSRLSYDKNATLNPWAWIDVEKWESNNTQPGKVIVQFPPRFRVDTPKSREEFQQHFDGVVTLDNAWTYTWKGTEGLVVCEPVPNIPHMAPYPGSADKDWSKIPLGVGTEGEIYWDLDDTPHLLVCGGTGGGKSVLQRNIIFHVIQHSDDIKFLGIDLKRVELKPFTAYKDAVLAIATSLEDGVEVMRYGRDEMERRYSIMEEMGVNHFRDLPEKMPALMIMVDEAFMFMGSEGIKTDEGKERDELHGEATMIIGAIARLGRASGVHLVIATQRPDAKVIYGEIKANLSARYVAGRVGATPSLMILDTDTGTRIPGDIRGRGVIQFNGAEQFIQGYFAEQAWIDNWLEDRDKSPEELEFEEEAAQPTKGRRKLTMFGRKLNLKNEEDENPIANIPDNEDNMHSGFLEEMDPELSAYEDKITEERQDFHDSEGTSQLDTLMADENVDLDMSLPSEKAQQPTYDNSLLDEMETAEEEPAPTQSALASPPLVFSNERETKPELPVWDDELNDVFAELGHNKPSDSSDSDASKSDINTPLEPPQLGKNKEPSPAEAAATLAGTGRPSRPERPVRPTP